MKVVYKGFDIDVSRDRSMGGDVLLYYSVFRKSDGYEVTSGFTSGTDTVRSYVGYMKERVDDFVENPQDYVDEEREKQKAEEVAYHKSENLKTQEHIKPCNVPSRA